MALVSKLPYEEITTNPDFSNVILKALGDQESLKIIQCVMESAKVIDQIIRETSIPQTSAYRKVHGLTRKGILFKTGKNKDGTDLYQTIGQKILINFSKNNQEVKLRNNTKGDLSI